MLSRCEESSDGSAEEGFFEAPNQWRRRTADISLLSASEGSDKNEQTSPRSYAGSSGDPSAGNFSQDESFSISQENPSDSDFLPPILDSSLQPSVDMEEELDGAPNGIQTIESHTQEQSQ